MESFSRLLLWVFVTVLFLQIVRGGWKQMRAWLGAKFIGVQTAAA